MSTNPVRCPMCGKLRILKYPQYAGKLCPSCHSIKARKNLRSKIKLPSIVMPTRGYVLGYLGGFLDADGCVSEHRRNGSRSRWTVVVSQKDPEIIAWLLREMGGGTVSFNKSTGVFNWGLHRKADVSLFCRTLASYSWKANRYVEANR